jgi:FKBP-type peptidyl-prolyl cis-trans isomerase SlyD
MEIAEKAVVSIHYTLTDDAGTVLDSSQGREPLSYLQGAGNIVPGLERALEGRQSGDSFNVDVPPEQGYGPHNPALIQNVSLAAFQGVDKVEPGMRFTARGPQGEMSIVVTAITGDQVVVDANHPLAGKTLHFAVEVTEVREASEQELNDGHAVA